MLLLVNIQPGFWTIKAEKEKKVPLVWCGEIMNQYKTSVMSRANNVWAGKGVIYTFAPPGFKIKLR